MKPWLAVALGGALGTLLRFGVVTWTARRGPERFPLGTLAVNVAGSLLIGAAAARVAAVGASGVPGGPAFVMVGICGGLTTFSAFALQTLVLVQSGRRRAAALNVALTLGLCLGAVSLGFLVVTAATGAEHAGPGP